MNHKTLTMTRSMDITERLTRRIVDGVYPESSKLPTERALAEEFEVARHVVREALKRIEAIGLVRIRQGSGIYVQRLHFLAGLEIFDLLLTNDDGSTNFPFLRDVLEFRGNLVRTIVRLAVANHTDEESDRAEALVGRLTTPGLDNERREAISAELFELIAHSSHNQVYALLYNSVARIFIKLRRMFDIPLMGPNESRQVLLALMMAYRNRDAEGADLLMQGYLAALDASIRNMAGVAPAE